MDQYVGRADGKSFHHALVLFQCDNYGFSVPVVLRNCVAVLDKGTAIACEARLAMNVDKLTELAIITLKEH